MAGLPSRRWAERFAEHAIRRARADYKKINQVLPVGGRAGRAIDDLLGDYSNPVTGSVRVYREHDEIRFQPLDAPIFNGRLRPLGGNVNKINLDEMALATHPLDPLLRVKATRKSVVEGKSG